MKKAFLLLTLLICLATASTASAYYVVDTGEPVAYSGSTWLLSPSNPASSLGAKFTLYEPTVITGIEGYMSAWQQGGPISVSVRSSAGNIPGSTNYFYNGFDLYSFEPGWYGATGIDQLLPAGDYWVVFGIWSIFSNKAAMYSYSPSPLANEAYCNGAVYGTWFPHNDLNLGIRITGEEPGSNVPLPPAVLMLGSGLVGLLISRRKK